MANWRPSFAKRAGQRGRTPRGTSRRRLHIVQHGHFGSEDRSLLGGREAARPAANHHEVVVEPVGTFVGHGIFQCAATCNPGGRWQQQQQQQNKTL